MKQGKMTVKKGYAIGLSVLAACAAVLFSVAQFRSDTAKSISEKNSEKQNQTQSVQTETKPVLAADELTIAIDVLNEASSVLDEKQKEAQAVFEQAKRETETTTAIEQVNAEPKSYTLPVGATLVKDFSLGVPVWSSTMGDWRTHNGVDFAAEAGEEVSAACACTVTAVSEDRSWGGVVDVDCGDGLTARYCGLDYGLITVKAGEQLQEGEVIGVIGSVPVEDAEGPHLHLEFRVNGEITDPLAIMGRDGTDEQ